MTRWLQKQEFYYFIIIFVLFVSCDKKCETPGTLYSVVFHEVSPTHLHGPCVSPDYFRDVLKMIQIGNKQTLLASEILPMLDRGQFPPQHFVAITFDDGWSGAHDYAEPLLRQFGMKATFFISTGSIEQGRPRYCSWSDLNDLAKTGHWEMHSHSVLHNDLTEVKDDSLQMELVDSRKAILDHGFSPADLIAYPYGHCNDRVKDLAKRSGYRAGFIAGGTAQIRIPDDRFALPRTTICQLCSQDLVCRKLGLNTKTIREDLAIYDEGDGIGHGSWILSTPDPAIPRGLYGSGYMTTRDPLARWSVNIRIDNPGDYEISLWTPVATEEALDLNETGFWLIQWEDGTILQKEIIPLRTKNGWTKLGVLNFIANSYEIALVPNLDTCKNFVVDALKIERLSAP